MDFRDAQAHKQYQGVSGRLSYG